MNLPIPPNIVSIAGFARSAPEVCSFALPILKSSSGEFFYCDPTMPDLVSLIPTGELGKECYLLEEENPLSSFKFPMYAFEITEAYFVTGNAWALSDYLAAQVEGDKNSDIFSPAQRRAIQRFSEDLTAWPDMSSTFDAPIMDQLMFI